MEYFTKQELEENLDVPTITFWSRSGDKSPLECLTGIPSFRESGSRVKRQRLSNFSEDIIHMDGESFPSAEHAFQSEKCKFFGFTERAREFQCKGRYGTLKPYELKKYTGRGKEGIKVDSELLLKWESSGSNNALIRVVTSKFTDNLELMLLLWETGKARLIHVATRRGRPTVYQRWNFLEELRDQNNVCV